MKRTRYSNLIFQFKVIPDDFSIVFAFWDVPDVEGYFVTTNLDGTKKFRYALVKKV